MPRLHPWAWQKGAAPGATAACPQDAEPYTPAECFALWEAASEHRAAGLWAESVPIHRELLEARPGEGQVLYYLALSLIRSGQQVEALDSVTLRALFPALERLLGDR